MSRRCRYNYQVCGGMRVGLKFISLKIAFKHGNSTTASWGEVIFESNASYCVIHCFIFLVSV